jgi:hypothetical protein
MTDVLEPVSFFSGIRVQSETAEKERSVPYSLVTVRDEKVRIGLSQIQIDRADPMSPVDTAEYAFLFTDLDEPFPRPPYGRHGGYRIKDRDLDPSLPIGFGRDLSDLFPKPVDEVGLSHGLVEDVMNSLGERRLADVLYGLATRPIDGLAREDDIALSILEVTQYGIEPGSSVLDKGDRL